jgi:hypothetical protein
LGGVDIKITYSQAAWSTALAFCTSVFAGTVAKLVDMKTALLRFAVVSSSLCLL